MFVVLLLVVDLVLGSGRLRVVVEQDLLVECRTDLLHRLPQGNSKNAE